MINIRNFQAKVRKWHKYLGLVFGIQFMLWTVGGLYFSWTNIKSIRGDDLRKPKQTLSLAHHYMSVDSALSIFKKQTKSDSITAFQLTVVLSKNYYQIQYLKNNQSHAVLIDCESGIIKEKITKTEAEQIAQNGLKGTSQIQQTQLIEKVDAHHEYREKPLPAYAVSFINPANTTVYVSAENGTLQNVRTRNWRIFDFLWMLHTMDYSGRDNINNLLLRFFSIFGIVTLLSGFVLYFISSKK